MSGPRPTTEAGSAPAIRPAQRDDLTDVLALNQANVPEVGATTLERLERFLAIAELFLVARGPDGRLAAFIIVLREDTDYDSPNYRWFDARHDAFLYVDRIAVADTARGQGLGRRLYDLVVERARALDRPRVCAEVNVLPRNDPSLAFHARYGFVVRAEVADPRYAEQRVAMVELELD